MEKRCGKCLLESGKRAPNEYSRWEWVHISTSNITGIRAAGRDVAHGAWPRHLGGRVGTRRTRRVGGRGAAGAPGG